MIFISLEFALFLLVVICLLYFVHSVDYQNIILFIASIYFYARSDWRFLFLVLFETLIVYLLALRIDQVEKMRSKKIYLVIGIAILLIILALYKYFNFFVGSICTLFNVSNTGMLEIILPLGISFYTFQGLSMLIDVYLGKVIAEKKFVNVSLCIAFFPQITSGPIVQAKNMLPQLQISHKITCSNLQEGLQIIMVGVLKKKVIADRLAIAVNAVYEAPIAYSGISLIFIILTYSIQIYCDFSGYSDIAIGIGRLLGFDLGRNFNLPYLSRNTSEFWRRWHISLSTWFKDYVYIPLGGSKKGNLRTYCNLFITMLLSGLWHGAGWQYILWGGMYGICNSLQKVNIDLKKKIHRQAVRNNSLLVRIVETFTNFIVVSLLWVFFRASSIENALLILKRIFTLAPGVTYIYTYTIIWGIILFVFEIYTYYKNNGNDRYYILKMDKFVNKVILLVIILFIICFSYIGNNTFIYAQY